MPVCKYHTQKRILEYKGFEMNSSNIQITKRDGTKEDLDLDKLHKVVFYACDGITGVSPSEVEIRSHIQFYDGMQSADIQETLINLHNLMATKLTIS